jgi:hypothetical protein
MPISSRGNGSYYVDLSGQIADELWMLKQRAAERGQGRAFTVAFRHLIQALRRDPLAAGEPLYALRHLGLHVRTIAVAPLVIDYAVDERRAIVYLKVCKLLSAPAS